MASKKSKAPKMQKFCRIGGWLKDNDPDLYQVVDDMCMFRALSAGRRGVTLLYPTAAVRKEIVEKAYSAAPEDAIELLNAHIIPTAVKVPADFARGVGSRKGVKLEVEASTAAGVTLKGGAKLKPAASFTALRRDNIAVWEVVSGRVPLDGPAFSAAPAARGRAAPAAVTGGAAPGPNRRAAYARNLEADFCAQMARDGCAARDPYLEAAVSLLNFLKAEQPALCAALLGVADRDPMVTFYLLVQPYKTAGTPLIPEAVMFGPAGWNCEDIFVRPVAEFAAFFAAAPDAAAARQAVDAARLAILGADGRQISLRSTPAAVRGAYAALYANSLGAIVPQATLAAVGSAAEKLWQDEFRFLLHSAMQEVRAEHRFDRAAFQADIVGGLLLTRPGDRYDAETSLTNPAVVGPGTASRALFELLIKFVNSTDFLYVPVPTAQIGSSWGKIPNAAGAAGFHACDMNVYNAEVSKQGLLAYLARGGDAPRRLSRGAVLAASHRAAAQA